ncbi:hypothetical protein M409DRAFT_25018 [Zasmidium cellare ATCC 36951]|uniref:SAP domain-containing protein n=1 Tax=Zasmidium cellare ATCC 36951 TaxID=1080233 RepID=A0A6A6CC72_ZASCE|nr:uncharacterized protein M409DRAFT_25018 [Zasmidium cellare ATCC 36951]KAF2164621.1 hypothetical protein M409DRAFT_25018 [Zasmidium cellare ATCC 36951]
MTDYSKLKVAELKDLVKERGIASTGLKVKQNYVDALIADDGAGDGDESVKNGKEEAEQPAKQEPSDAKDEPVAESLQQDEVDEHAEEQGNKRKRRSPTPPLSEESVNKKIKTMEMKTEEDVGVKLPEDVVADAPAPVDGQSETQAKVLPYGSSDDVMDVKQEDATGDSRMQDTELEHDTAEDDALPSKHPITRALYIRDLVRPLQPNFLRDHLLSLAQKSATGDVAIEDFHLDKLRTHAFVLFDTTSAAKAVRQALHDRIWPDEPMRKPLWVDYIPDSSVRDWIDTEVGKGDLTRWEVVYSSADLDTDGPVTASLREADAGASNARNTARQPTGAGEGMPNAPSGPRRQSTQYQQPAPPRSPEEDHRPQSKNNDTLDDMYPFTQNKPKIYYQPVPRELVDRRLEEFEKEKSRDWDDRFADPAAYAEGELRRYTFEDGDRLVDGGADFGLFGRNSRGGMRGGGRGRGRGGDRYRGGGRR